MQKTSNKEANECCMCMGKHNALRSLLIINLVEGWRAVQVHFTLRFSQYNLTRQFNCAIHLIIY